MKPPLQPLALLPVAACVLACLRPSPVADLRATPRSLSLPYPHRASVELTWRPRRPLEVPAGEVRVFAHLIDGEGGVQRTFDHPFPDAWTPGSEVAYRLDLLQSAIAPRLAAGSYRLTLGLYAESGRRWPLDVAGAEVGEGEYALVEVAVPPLTMGTPRFDFAGAWGPPRDTGGRQVLTTRRLGGGRAELVIWGIDRAGEAVLSFAIPRPPEPAPEVPPAVAVDADCGGVRGRLSGPGSHEIRVRLPAAGGRRCTVGFVPTSGDVSAQLESASWMLAPPVAAPAYRRRMTRSPEVAGVSLPGPATSEALVLRNVGDGIVVDPRVIVDGRKDWFSIDSILSEILEPGFSDGEKALAIWELLVANRYHDDPVLDAGELHDPVRLLNVYGYGFCDDAANSFMMLARQAGLPARIWDLAGHVVAEAYVDGEWRVFDADGEVLYRYGDERQIAGVGRLSSNPRLIRRHPNPHPLYADTERMVEIYASKSDNRTAGWYGGESRHVMAYVLRPGESIRRSRRNWGLHVAGLSGAEPEIYGNGRFRFEPVLRDGLFRLGAAEVDGVSVEAVGGDRRELVFTAATGERARLAYPFASPYPLLAGRVQIVGELRGDGVAELSFSADGETWSRAWASSDVGAVDAEVPLAPFLRRDDGARPVYGYRLRMAWAPRAEGAQWRVATLRFESDFQHAPHALPSFDAGGSEVLYLDAGEGERQVEVIFEFGDNDAALPPAGS